MASSSLRSISWLTVLLLGTVAARGADEDLAWIDRAALERREVLVEAERERGPRVEVKVAALMDAPPEAVWEVLVACDLAPEYVPHVLSCRLLETLDDGRAQLFVQVV